MLEASFEGERRTRPIERLLRMASDLRRQDPDGDSVLMLAELRPAEGAVGTRRRNAGAGQVSRLRDQLPPRRNQFKRRNLSMVPFGLGWGHTSEGCDHAVRRDPGALMKSRDTRAARFLLIALLASARMSRPRELTWLDWRQPYFARFCGRSGLARLSPCPAPALPHFSSGVTSVENRPIQPSRPVKSSWIPTGVVGNFTGSIHLPSTLTRSWTSSG